MCHVKNLKNPENFWQYQLVKFKGIFRHICKFARKTRSLTVQIRADLVRAIWMNTSTIVPA